MATIVHRVRDGDLAGVQAWFAGKEAAERKAAADELRVMNVDVPSHHAKRFGTLLTVAAITGRIEIARWLRDVCGADPNLASSESDGEYGAAPLHYAAMQGRLDMVKWLAGKRHFDANPRLRVFLMGTVRELSEARKLGGKPELAKLIWEFAGFGGGADVNLAMTGGHRPLHVAAREGHLDVVKWLGGKGPDEGGADVNLACGCERAVPLYIAALNGHLNVVKWLAGKGPEEGGANVNLADKNGATPLYIAAYNGHLDVVKWLAGKDPDEGGADVNLAPEDNDSDDYDYCSSAIEIAILRPHPDMAQVLVDSGADLLRPDRDGYTPLHHVYFDKTVHRRFKTGAWRQFFYATVDRLSLEDMAAIMALSARVQSDTAHDIYATNEAQNARWFCCAIRHRLLRNACLYVRGINALTVLQTKHRERMKQEKGK